MSKGPDSQQSRHDLLSSQEAWRIARACKDLGLPRIASRREVMEALTGILRCDFKRWPKLKTLDAKDALNGMLKAAQLLAKIHGMFQEPSKNEQDIAREREAYRIWARETFLAAKQIDPECNPTADEVMAVLLAYEDAAPTIAQHEALIREEIDALRS